MTVNERIYDVSRETNLEFLGAGRPERMDLYRPADASPKDRFPGVVIIHGGGWWAGDRDAAREINIGTNLARMGYVCMSIDYLLATENTPSWPTNLHDCRQAVQYLRVNAEELQIDPLHIGCIGGSAGGHLSACLATMGPDSGLSLEPETPYGDVSCAVQAAVDLYGIADLFHWRLTEPDGTPLEAYRYDATTQMLGATHTDAPELWHQASPQSQAKASNPPIMIMHGLSDTCVDYQQSIDFAQRLEEVAVEHELILLEGVAHSFHLGARAEKPEPVDIRQRVLSFFDRHLKGLSADDADARYSALVRRDDAG